MVFNLLGIIWAILLFYSFSKEMYYTIMLVVLSLIFQNALFLTVGSARIMLIDLASLILIFRFFMEKLQIKLDKLNKSMIITVILFFVISIVDGMIFRGWEVNLYSEWYGLHKTGSEYVQITFSLIIALIRFSLYFVDYVLISSYASINDQKKNDEFVKKTLTISVYIVCMVGMIQVVNYKGLMDLSYVMEIVHDRNMGAASAYYAGYDRIYSTFAEPSYCGPWLNAAFCAVFYAKNQFGKYERYILLSVLFTEFILSGSFTGFITFFVCFLIMAIMYFRGNKKTYTYILLSISVLILLYLLGMLNPILLVIGDKLTSTSVLSRLDYMKDCYRVFFETLGLGIGYMQIKCMTLISGLLAQVGALGTLSFIHVIYLIVKKIPKTGGQRISYAFFIAIAIGGEISCSGLAYLTPFWFGLLLFSMNNGPYEEIPS